MNTKLKLGLGMAIASILGACSSDSISNADAENWPSDFTTAEYAEVNPDLANYQRITAVAKKNAAYKADSANASAAQSLSDSSELVLFFNNEAAVREIFTTYAGLEDDYWPVGGLSTFINGLSDTAGNINVSGLAATQYRTALEQFHCLGNTSEQDLAFLKSIVIDSTLIREQYVLAGKYEGRAYRFCHEGEAITKKLDVTVVYDTIPNGTKTYVWKDTVKYDTTGVMYLASDSSQYTEQSLGQHLANGDSITIVDTLMTVTEKKDSVIVDSTFSDKITRTTTTTPMSPNVISPAGGANRVWNFSADLYCKNKADGEIYLIQ